MPAAARSFRVYRELARLFALRLGQTGFGRIARFMSLSIALFATISIGVIRAEEGPEAATVKLATGATKTAMWLVALATALAASHQRSVADRKDGIEMLALSRGFDGTWLGAVRAGAAGWFAFRWMMVPVALASLASIASSGSAGVVGSRLLVFAALVVFAAIACSVLGALAAAADGVSPRRGRTVLLAVLLVSALVAEVARDPALSVTGGLLTVLNALLHAVGAGRLA